MAYRLPYYTEVRSTAYVLHNYNPDDNQRLQRMFSIWNKVTHRYQAFALFYDPERRDLYVPRGTNPMLVAPGQQPDQFIRTPPDPAMEVSPIKLKLHPRDDRQREAIAFCVGTGAYEKNRNRSQLCLNLPTGVGKTFVAVYTFAFYGLKTAMITSSTDWLNQWKDAILQYTDLTPKQVYVINGSSSIFKLLNGLIDHKLIKFYLCTHSTLYNWGKKRGWGAIRELFITLKIGVKIYDEAHLYYQNICRIDFFTNCAKTYYLTATPLKSDFYQNKIYQRSFEIVPKINLFDQENDPHVAYLAIRFNSRPSPYDMQRIASGSYGFNIFAYVQYFQDRPVFYDMLRIVLVHCLADMNPGDRMMIYFASMEAISLAARWIQFHFWRLSIGLYCSLVPKDRKHEQLEATCILTTTKSAQALLDISNLKKVVLFAEPFNSEPVAIQVMGRLRDADTEMIELVDCGFTRIYEWYRNKLTKVYAKYATEIRELTYTDEEIRDAIRQMDAADKERMDANRNNLKQIVDIEPRK